jgi:hypothetical protein
MQLLAVLPYNTLSSQVFYGKMKSGGTIDQYLPPKKSVQE